MKRWCLSRFSFVIDIRVKSDLKRDRKDAHKKHDEDKIVKRLWTKMGASTSAKVGPQRAPQCWPR
jgi:hypothetical protein